MIYYEIRFDPRQLMSIDTDVRLAPPDRTPDYPVRRLRADSTDWVDKLFDLFKPVMELAPTFTIIACVENGPCRYGEMRAWNVPNGQTPE